MAKIRGLFIAMLVGGIMSVAFLIIAAIVGLAWWWYVLCAVLLTSLITFYYVEKNRIRKLKNMKTIIMEEVKKPTYYDSGYQNSIQANGNSYIFQTCLEEIYEKFKEACRKNESEQEKLNAPYRRQKGEEEAKLKSREALQIVKEDKKEALQEERLKKKEDLQTAQKKKTDELQQKINVLDRDMSKAPNDPEKYGIDVEKKPKMQFYIGLVILAGISLFLFFLYSSVAYSVFYRNYGDNENISLADVLFDPLALINAWEKGLGAFMLVLMMPFIFMGLGYLVHMFQRGKDKLKTLKITALIIVTFVFDSLMAFFIDKKINEEGGGYGIWDALQSGGFWIIIFAGFVTYLIWGFVFDFVMKEHENIDKVRVFINGLKEQKETLKNHIQEFEKATEAQIQALEKTLGEQIQAIQKIIDELKDEIVQIKGTIHDCNAKIEGFIFPNRKYLAQCTEYCKGWYLAISNEISLPHDKKDKLIEQCKTVSDKHLEFHGINENYEQRSYNQTYV